MADRRSISPSPTRTKEPVSIPLAAVIIQPPDALDAPPIPGSVVAALLDMAVKLYGAGLVRFADPDAVEGRARDLAGVADMLIDALEAATGIGQSAPDSLAVVREGFLELACRVRAVAGHANSYHIIIEAGA